MIGIMDWGIGGLWALLRLRERVPQVDITYLSDAGDTPYGLQSRARLRDSVHRSVARLRGAGAERILVACHSASTALRDLPDAHGVHGVIEPEAVPASARHIAVLGGARTIRSQCWRRALHDRPRVTQRIAQPLSAAVEAGLADDASTLRTLRHILAPVHDADAVVLACTHYAALRSSVQRALPGASVIDPALFVADRLPARAGQGRLRAMTTGDPEAISSVVARALPELRGLAWERAAPGR